MPTLSPKYIDNLKLYKHSGCDNSITLKYVLSHFYNYIIEFFPKTIAPNLITLLGFCAVLVSVVLVLIHSPTLSEPLPSWVMLVNGICLFTYQTLDNLDGKQARRTGTSSPLGELLDHGVDALSCIFGAFMWLASVSLGTTIYSYTVLVISCLPFLMATWEEYYVGGLYLGYLNGPIEGLLFVSFSQVLGFFFGHELFTMSLPQVINEIAGVSVPLGPLSEVPFGILCTSVTLLIAFTTSIGNLMNVRRAVKEKKISFARALLDLVPGLTLLSFFPIWIVFSPTDVFAEHPFMMLTTFAFNFGYIVSNITLAYVMKAPYKRRYLSMLPLFVAVANCIVARFGEPLVNEEYLVYCYLFIAVASHLNYSRCVINEITEFLGIRFITVPAPKDKDN